MKLEFLGTGNCACVPVYGCNCTACSSSRSNPQLKRLPTCGRISTRNQTILIDAGHPDLAEIAPRASIDRVLLTHYHVDHVQGLFHIRWGCCTPKLPVHGPNDQNGCADLLKHPGILDFTETLFPFESRMFGDIEVTPLPLNHSKPTLGYAFETTTTRVGWLTDTSGLPSESIDFLVHWSPDIIVIDCSFPPLKEPHANHNDITAVLTLHRKIRPGKTFLTHISHQLDEWLMEHLSTLPDNVIVSRDRLIV